ncbi:3-deoxy-7-phosphoheptulonate synthase [Amorphoplanes digitatis]|uniref:3-deoxy-7-phosphoheptulonate synthase n=1 Tax=Actinoplanes digitatis TaxID=1868 RepID=A0A7W7HWE3_9ACTN|nr:3-deoxy-7-phosphoheptulonate synthase [Actinoplanes digitatis]MBB4762001.1 3-deoxy-7-phosphoheptulonate synthase [Actinoplanes digitatis]BFE70721.1 3-deoxy-7-phosphoheptulonate synthase [Actinoplanes digitatis]GID91114.1 3-deoxy-7-phosphoheptulonate synthase [Actinoplanes digitatis]
MTVLVVLTDSSTRNEQQQAAALIRRSCGEVREHSPSLLSTVSDLAVVDRAVGHLPQVRHVARVQGDYPRASVQSRMGRPSTVALGEAAFGPGQFTVIAGPCSVDNHDQLMEVGHAVRDAGGHALRGGAFKPRSSPYAFQGLGRRGLELLAEARRVTGLPIVTEVLDVRDLPAMLPCVDMLQVGARNMQNFALLRELGTLRTPVLLKRGLAASIDETLMAAEYILDGGNTDVVICERGIRTFETGYRFTLDIGAVPVFKERSHLPIIVDPSHAAGETARVIPLALAAAACGADGIIVETHSDPAAALCDGKQALPTSRLPELIDGVVNVARVAGRTAGPTMSERNDRQRELVLTGDPAGTVASARVRWR